MTDTHYTAIVGLGFGDCGKGRFVDQFAGSLGAHSVVRFNGGAQAGHNVVTPEGLHHTFSQFSSGTFLPHVVTVLAQAMVVHPLALLVEADVLAAKGVQEPLARILVDGACRVTTPLHQALGRLRELARGHAAHGTCGVGVGETVRQWLVDPEAALTYADLAHSARALAKLEHLRRRIASDIPARSALPADDDTLRELTILNDERITRAWLIQVREQLIGRAPPIAYEHIAARLRQPGAIVLEGAQGTLLDEEFGFHPYTTWSRPGVAGVLATMQHYGLALAPVRHLGVIRTYATRHGPGPLPTEDGELDILAEPHNSHVGWQGRFRRGHFDAVLLRYACDVNRRIDGLLVSHLDALDRPQRLRWCESYRLADDPATTLTRLEPGACGASTPQTANTEMLRGVRPNYEERALAGAHDFIERIEAFAGIPVVAASTGSRAADIFAR